MYELLLFSSVPESSHTTLLHQLAGITRMQPIPTTEHHLVFRPNTPPGLDRVLQQGSGSGGGSQGIAAPEVKRTRDMLTGSLYHLQLVRDISDEISTPPPKEVNGETNHTNGVTTDDDNINNNHKPTSSTTTLPKPNNNNNWTIQFSDIPDPSTTLPVTSRFVSRTPIETPPSSSTSDALTHATTFLSALDYSPDPQSSYLLHGHKFYDTDTTIFLYQILTILTLPSPNTTTNIPALSTLTPLDASGSYILQASIDVDFQPQGESKAPPQASSSSAQDSAATGTGTSAASSTGGGGGGAGASFAELRAQATAQLLALRETLRGSGMVLAKGDRLALDTRLKGGRGGAGAGGGRMGTVGR